MVLGHYKAGEMLSFSKLADEFGVSRQPISTAISHLRTLGYVDILPQVGCRVVAPSLQELKDFFKILGRIEGAIAFMAAERYRDLEAEDLRALTPKADLSEVLSTANRLRYLRYLDEFHERVWRMARTPLLFNQFGGLRRLSSFYLWQGQPNLTPDAARLLTKERDEIAETIARRNAQGASELMEKHVSNKPLTAGLLNGDEMEDA